jgi:hypothetical protein
MLLALNWTWPSCFGMGRYLYAVGLFDFRINLLHEHYDGLVAVPSPNTGLHSVRAVLQGDFVGYSIGAAAELRKIHTDGCEFLHQS